MTGEVAVTLGAAHEGMVAGDAVNTAARVQSAADSGQVLVDGVTRRLAGAGVGFADAGEHAAEGQGRARSIFGGRPGCWPAWADPSGSDGLEAPLTGRDAELRTIRELFHAAAERRVPRLVVVARAGRSRQVAAGLGARASTSKAWRKPCGGTAGGAWPTGRGWRSGRWRRWCASGWRSPRRTPPKVAAGKLAEGLEGLVPDPGEQAYVRLRLGRLLGVSVAGDSGLALAREELFAGWRLFFGRLAAEHPVLLMVEDAQYADEGMLAFLDYLIDWSRDLPVYVLVLARPRARPSAPEVRHRAQPDHADPGSTGWRVDGPTGGGPGAGHDGIGASGGYGSGTRDPAIRGRNGPLADRPRHRPAHRRGIPARR